MKEIIQLIHAEKIELLHAFFSQEESKRIWKNSMVTESTWFALVDVCQKKVTQGKQDLAGAWLELFMLKGAYPINERVLKGEYPIFWCLEKNEFVFDWLQRHVALNLNIKNSAGVSIEDLLIKKIKEKSFDLLKSRDPDSSLTLLNAYTQTLCTLIKEKKDLDKEAGVAFLFPLFLAFSLYPKASSAKQAEQIAFLKQETLELRQGVIEHILEKGIDINQPKLCSDLSDSIKINTPLAYMLKRLGELHQRVGAYALLENQFLNDWVDFLMQKGADPCLQLEKTHQVHLMKLVKDSGALPGLAEFIEKRMLLQAVSESTTAVGQKNQPRKRL